MRGIIFAIVGICFLLTGSINALADSFTFDFYGEILSGEEGYPGIGTATMGIEVVGNTVTVEVDNTSPTLNDNMPGITAFGFDFENAGDLVLSSWSLNNGVDFVASDAMQRLWSMESSDDGIAVDILPNTRRGSNYAFYNPFFADRPANNSFFDTATLTLQFNTAPLLNFDGEWSPFVRMQSVGLGGEGSLKLPGIVSTPVPEPGTMIIFGVCFATLAGFRLRKKK